ncbi:hypothetical protein B0H66DRAFT_537476 [Apodospora peruviana]|uniref:Uncharacterized protein n=1 Tax=Apodospora peruviana TaxID=516989 RepID=A0AAE0HX75_9PEZI|nr:hypothetical protein B0H66DRAFT_537476 [Apodospora peruviana]
MNEPRQPLGRVLRSLRTLAARAFRYLGQMIRTLRFSDSLMSWLLTPTKLPELGGSGPSLPSGAGSPAQDPDSPSYEDTKAPGHEGLPSEGSPSTSPLGAALVDEFTPF